MSAFEWALVSPTILSNGPVSGLPGASISPISARRKGRREEDQAGLYFIWTVSPLPMTMITMANTVFLGNVYAEGDRNTGRGTLERGY